MQQILAKIPTTPLGENKHLGYCPGCGDASPSLVIEQVPGVIFLACKNGCNPAEIVYAIRLNMCNLFQSWNYWRINMFLGLILIARREGIKISAVDKDVERQAFIKARQMEKAANARGWIEEERAA